MFYDGEAPLLYRLDNGEVRIIFSSEGSQQGDPAGGFLFCLGFARVLTNISDRLPDALVAAASDDVTIGIATERIPLAWEVAREECAAYGILLSDRKCRIYTPNPITTVPANLAPPNIRCTSDGIHVLGIPVGTEEFKHDFISDLRQDHQRLLSSLPLLGDTQCALLLLRYCALPRTI